MWNKKLWECNELDGIIAVQSGIYWGLTNLGRDPTPQELNEWSIYRLFCPITNMARFIGITTQPLDQRLKYHLRGKDHNPGKANWITWLQLQGLQPDILPIVTLTGTRAQV